ncbi:peripheral-type benzodiazepine receptor-associated protein 1-like isoform X3 [Amphibalanus amphitrite]|uniref:peripheral-type benzodiazepine receptor-associated protein 1-like isoform X3 n=1 Tax=Amphibalanus amphitrite TaxID=1232801 RepID=UPI001C9125B4|nr:peripheral-type benzodiazepine receptor-associated protein 1-like isoform X3 [Amphibalanus amphitrite]
MEPQAERERPPPVSAAGRSELELPAPARQEQESFIDETETETESGTDTEGSESETEAEMEGRGSRGSGSQHSGASDQEAENEERDQHASDEEEEEEDEEEEECGDCEEDDCEQCEGAVGGHFSDAEEMAPERSAAAGAGEDDEEAVLRELARSSAPAPATPGLDSLRSESGICSSLESSYQEEAVGAAGAAAQSDDQLARLRRDLAREARQELRHAIAAKNEELRELRSQLQLGRQRAASAELLGQRRPGELPQQQQQLSRLRERIKRLQTEREELKAEAQLSRIREKQRSAELRRLRQQQQRQLRQLMEESGRESVRETRELRRLQEQIERKDQELSEREKQIEHLECQKCYLGEEILRITGVEEGFWSDEVLKSSRVTDRERELLRRSSQLDTQVKKLQIQCKNLKLDNNGLKTAMDAELEKPLAIRVKAAERLRETQLLKKKNQELTNMTRKLEEKVKTLEKKSREVSQQQQERSRTRIVRQLPQTRAVPPEIQQRMAPSLQQKTTTVQKRTVSAPQRTVSAGQRTVSAGQRTVRTVSASPQRSLNGEQNGSSVSSSSERLSQRERPGLQQRTTLTAKQRERESEYQRQIKERDSEIKRLKERMKIISDKLSKKNELQILKEKGKKELVSVITQLQREKAKLEMQMNALAEEQRNQRASDVDRFQALEEQNITLSAQLNELNKLVQDHKEIQTQFEEKIEECEQLAESLHIKNELCDDLEKQLTRVIEKNTELTIQNSDLQRQIHELDSISSQCASLKESLNSVGTEYESAKFEVETLKEKVSTLESVLRQMRDAAERKKELEKQHQEAQQQLRQKQEEIATLTKASESEKQASLDTIQTLESKIRELEKKAEVQSLRHEELMLEMSSLKKQNKYKNSQDGSPDGTITPDSMLLSTESTARSTPVGTAITPASLDALPEVDESPFWTRRVTDIQLPARSVSGPSSASLELDKFRAQMESDTKFLAELDRARSALGLAASLASSGAPAAVPQPVYLTSALPTLPAGLTQLGADQLLPTNPFSAGYPAAGGALLPPGYSLDPALRVVPVAGTLPAALPGQVATVQAIPAGLYRDDKAGLMNGTVPGLLPANMAHHLNTTHAPGVVDVLDIPGKGKCQVFIARYSYDPFQHSPNEAPESELRLNAGDYVLVWGEVDEDGFLDGETLDGRRGLVPSNFVQKLVGEDLLEFHRQVVAGLRDCDRTSVSTCVPHDLDFNSADEALLNNMDEYAAGRPVQDGYGPPAQYPAQYRYEGSLLSDDEEEEHLGGGPGGQGTVPPPRQLTLERQLNKSVVIGWNAPDAPPGTVDCYHVYVDGLLRTSVRASERTCALIEGVDSSRPHRISVRAVTPNRRTSRDAACTMLIGKDVPLAPTAVRATNVTSTSAVISWLPSNSNFQHTVCVNSVEVRTVKPGVYRHTITGISPNTTYRVSVKVKNITAPQFASRTPKQLERLATHIEFRTLPKGWKGVPDPPVDVQCELGPQEGSLLVTWLPVTINSTSGTSNGAPVTGYAVYADGKKVTELGSPTGDHALIELNSIAGFHPRQVTVRTKSRDLVSADSVPCPIPQRAQRKSGSEPGTDPADGGGGDPGQPPPAPPDPELYNILANTAEALPPPPPAYSSQFAEYETDELSDIPEEAENELSDSDQQSESGRMKSQHDQAGSAHSSPLAGRRRMPAAGPSRGHPHQQQVLVTEENLSDKEVYPSGYMSIPQIEITKDSASEGRGSVDASEEDCDHRGLRGRRRGPGERGRPPPPPPHDPRQQRHRPPPADPYRDNNYAGGNHRNDAQSGAPPPPRRAAGPREERMRIFVALFDYDPPTMSPNPDACDEELPFREGQLIKIYGDKDGDGFYWGEASGRAGYVPCNMVSEVQVDDERLAQELLKEEDRPTARGRSGGGGGGGGGGRPRSGQEDRWGDIYSSTPVRRMVALYDYDPQELSPNVDAEVELSFNTGDIIHVYGDMDDDGFYIGEVNGVRGLVPSNFLTETPQNYDRRRGGPEGPSSSERRGPPGPGVHGPPLPPRDKGDSRDRRKDPPISHVDIRPDLASDPPTPSQRPENESATSAASPADAGSAGKRLPNGAPPGPAAGAEQPPSKTGLLGGLSSPGGFIKGLGGGLSSAASAARVPSFVIPSGGGAAGATGANATGEPPPPPPAGDSAGPNLMQKLGGMTGEAGGAVEGIMSKGKELIFKRFGL